MPSSPLPPAAPPDGAAIRDVPGKPELLSPSADEPAGEALATRASGLVANVPLEGLTWEGCLAWLAETSDSMCASSALACDKRAKGQRGCERGKGEGGRGRRAS